MHPDDRLAAQFAFLNEADRLKSVLRATTLCDGSRPENSGEHSWHLALYALTLADQAEPGVDINRVIRMLLLHDLVEIDVGDVPIHSANGAAHASTETQAAEQRAAVKARNVLAMIAAGGNVYYLAKLAGIFGLNVQDIGAQQTGMSVPAFKQMLLDQAKGL